MNCDDKWRWAQDSHLRRVAPQRFSRAYSVSPQMLQNSANHNKGTFRALSQCLKLTDFQSLESGWLGFRFCWPPCNVQSNQCLIAKLRSARVLPQNKNVFSFERLVDEGMVHGHERVVRLFSVLQRGGAG